MMNPRFACAVHIGGCAALIHPTQLRHELELSLREVGE